MKVRIDRAEYEAFFKPDVETDGSIYGGDFGAKAKALAALEALAKTPGGNVEIHLTDPPAETEKPTLREVVFTESEIQEKFAWWVSALNCEPVGVSARVSFDDLIAFLNGIKSIAEAGMDVRIEKDATPADNRVAFEFHRPSGEVETVIMKG